MTPRYLLDTNIASDLVRNPGGVVADHVIRAGSDVVCTSIIVAAELRYGAAKRSSPRLTEQLEKVLGRLHVLALEPPVDAIYGELRFQLEAAGRLISPNDLLIACHALSLGCALVTDNTREFTRVEGLRVVNWLRR